MPPLPSELKKQRDSRYANGKTDLATRAVTVTGNAGSKSTKRAQERAAKRAGRTCEHCGKPIVAQRSTRRTCSDACRVAARRAKGAVPTKKQGLAPAQVLILTKLAELDEDEVGYRRGTLTELTGVSTTRLSVHLGETDRSKRDATAVREGRLSLLKLAYVRLKVLDVDGKKETWFTITTAGRMALKRAKKGR